MDNMSDYYSGLQKAEAQSKAAREAEANPWHGDDSSSDDNDDLFDDIDFSDEVTRANEKEEAFISMWELENDDAIILDSVSLDPAACPTTIAPSNKVSHVINIFKKHKILNSVAKGLGLACGTRASWSTAVLPPVELMKKWVHDVTTDNALICAPSNVPVSRDTQVIELLSDALVSRNLEWQPSLIRNASSSLSVEKRHASISEVLKQFTLNEKQHYAFRLMGQALLSRWKRAEESEVPVDDLGSVLRDNQVRMFLGGEGGTGKSCIIDAVHALCNSWGRSGRSDCLVKTALTGKAATLIGGRILASFLLQIRRKKSVDSLAFLDLIIVDKFSMMEQYQLTQLDKQLRVAKRVADAPFGGIHVVLVGDFLQLPPVGGQPVFNDPTKTKRKSAKISADELAGCVLWQSFTDVIMLSESVRFRKDPEWGHGCQQARRGVWTPEFVCIINSRLLTNDEALNDAVANERYRTFVTPDNATRISINNLFISTAAKLLPHGEYPVRVVANFKGKLNNTMALQI